MDQKDYQNKKTTINGKVEKILLHDQKDARVILSFIKEDGKSCSLIGYIHNIEKGDTFTSFGVWKKDKKYGWQFMADTIELIPKAREMQELVDDGLISAIDFSNVLNSKIKAFRNVDLEYEEDDLEDFDNFEEYMEPTLVYPNKQNYTHLQNETQVDVVDGATYDEDLTVGINGINKDDTAFDGCDKNTLVNEIEIEWNDVLFRDGFLLVMEGEASSNIVGRESLGYQVTARGKRVFIAKIRHKEVKAYMGNIIRRINTSLPRIIIRFQLGSKPYVVNVEALDEAIGMLSDSIIVTTEDVD